MSQAGYTPIQLYYSTTALAVPVNTNLANGELAINITDGKLYYKDNTGTVKLLASNATSAPVLSFSAGTTGFTPNTATSGAITLAGTLATTNGGTGLTSFTSGGVVYASSSSALATGSALSFDGTNLGIGTSSIRVSSKLDVRGDVMTLGSNATYYATIDYSAGTGLLSLASETGGGGGIRFLSGASELARITASGNVGIGTSSPAYKLDVAGQFSRIGQSGGAGAGLIFAGASATKNWVIANQYNVSGCLEFTQTTAAGGSTISGTPSMVINASGNVGIATTSPRGTLDVNGTILVAGGGQIQITGSVSSTGLQLLGQDAAESIVGTLGAQPLVFRTGSSERFRIGTAGQLGIGGATYGTAGQVLTSGGPSAPPTWAAGGGGGGSPAGSTGQFQYNNAGSFAAAPVMTTTGTNVRFNPTSSNKLQFFNTDNATDSIQFFTSMSGPYYYSLENYAVSPNMGLMWGNNNFVPGGWANTMTFVNMNVCIGGKIPGAKFHIADGSNLYMGDAGSVGWSGNPIIRNPANSGYLILMNGSGGGVGLTGGGTSWSSLSDERHKTNLVPIENGLAKVMTLRAVTGRFIVDNAGASRSFLIAQDVQKVLPEAVSTADDGRIMLSYTDTIPLLVAAIKELKAEFDAYKLSHP